MLRVGIDPKEQAYFYKMWSFMIRKLLVNCTIHTSVFFCLCLCFTRGVFGVDGDKVKSVSVMEGDSVTLHTDITDIKTDDHIVWMFGPKGTRIAQIYMKDIGMFNSNEIFGNRLKLDSQTGSLTITNITIKHTGLYKLQIFSEETSNKRFNITVYAPLPAPIIVRNKDLSHCPSSSSSSSSKCVLLCSVLNVRDVSLSWYKGNSLLSNISVSDLNIRLSLPLEVEYQDNNTYRCVLNNTITNQTQHLNINHLCQTCSAERNDSGWIIGVVVGAILLILVAVVVALAVKNFRKILGVCKEQRNEFQTHEEVIYIQTTCCTQQLKQSLNPDGPFKSVYSSVVMRVLK